MTEQRRTAVSRRALLTAGGLTAAATAGAVAAAAVGRVDPPGPEPQSIVAFHGDHQAGVETGPQAHAAFVAFTLRAGTDREAAVRMMRLASEDAARLTRAEPALGDQEPELATTPARLTVTFGFGPTLFTSLGLTGARPAGLVDLPAYPIDRLRAEFCGGDLLVQICADDQLVVAHAARQLIKTVRAFAGPRWLQRGFSHAAGPAASSGTPRNLMGQIDGTVNPQRASTDFGQLVWSTGSPAWFAGGTTVVLRRIAMHLDAWDELDRTGKELAVGRRLDTGAPLTGRLETDLADLTARDTSGLPVIPTFAHIARAAPRSGAERFLRRPYSYDDGLAGGTSNSGLLFAAYQADIAVQYLPVQQRLAQQDLLNDWTTPVGSAAFALPPGCALDGYIGEGLLG